ncbi:B12-binding domain-containing radical SAM protein [Aquirufa regiilacus]|uniref:Radical SAM protein n=1 Tax=Aquirufa regiilacus TaxID=3024868 RepID=A0ABU3TSW3_9BACT|nr:MULTISPECIES: radical SAM protein [unclassified Aquirufa]MDT8887836.1 radical SAM protein [Aquirufa sp. LEPPI-3A]MDU0808948.1 radical SAM protein [Aquirufa sp. LEOWEIH-7C]
MSTKNPKVFFITPPFTQLNTPYPATAYLKGFLNTLGLESHQADLGLEVILQLFSKAGLKQLFANIEASGKKLNENGQRMLRLQQSYLRTIDPVISFLHDKNPTLAHVIAEQNYLPEASRFQQVTDLEWAFGSMGVRDKARHLATLYLEDISDLIIDAVDPHFGFSRYAERLGRSASSFHELNVALEAPLTYIDEILVEILSAKIQSEKPDLVAITAPFPGNLYSALRCGQWIKKHHPQIKVAFGGGYANTELRSLQEPRVFEFVDFITLDDGETPLMNLLEHLRGERELSDLKRTFCCIDGQVTYLNGSKDSDVKQKDVGVPDYTDLPLDKYLSVIEIANPMHRLWSDGRWNKLTLAHGCYWGKCTFCDISLSYIKDYEAATAPMLVDRIEAMIAQTGNNGFHFVDEAAPPALMRDVALEIIRRDLTVVWWTNIRFEKSFTKDLCQLLVRSGCIAVSGGLEVASDRLLTLIDKGVTVSQVAQVADHFTQAGILVHAYLMYGFPTQTAQETVDSLEVVRQLVENQVIHSGFWHQFALTAHSPVGLNPDAYHIKILNPEPGSFANNDLEHADPQGTDHAQFSEGLKKSLFNYMHGIGLDMPLQEWFEFKVPRTQIPKNYIARILTQQDEKIPKANAKICWLGLVPTLGKVSPGKTALCLSMGREEVELLVPEALGTWLVDILARISLGPDKTWTFDEFQKAYSQSGLGNFEQFWQGDIVEELREIGLLVV